MILWRTLSFCVATACAALLLGGCVAATKAPSADALGRFRQAHVVPLESHALTIEDSTSLAGATTASLGSIPQSGPAGQHSLLAAGTLMMLVEHLSASRRKDVEAASAQAEQALQRKGLWLPNVEVARNLAAQLARKGLKASVSEQHRTLPPLAPLTDGQLRPRSWQRVVDWYADESATDRYRYAGTDGTTVVLEVGVGNYTIGAGMFLCQVHVKLIDPASGAFLGRSRGYDYLTLAAGENLWANDGARFRALFTQITAKAVAEAVDGLGL